MNIDKKIIMGVRNKDADAKKELISLTRNHLVQTIYKRYIGLEEKEINDILQATYTYAFMNMDKLSDDKNFLKWITVLLNKQLREYMQDIANRLKMSEEGVARLLKSGKQKVKDVLDKK